MSIPSSPNRLSDRRKLSNEAPDKRWPQNEEEKPSDYYYDDSTGYRIYEDTQDDNDDEDDDPIEGPGSSHQED